MKSKIGFIGCGNMGEAMSRGIRNSQLFEDKNIILFDKNEKVMEDLAQELGATAAADEKEVARESDYLVLAVKPGVYPEVLEEISGEVKEDAIVVVIAVGVSFEDVYEKLGDVKVVRVQPSTPALVGESDSTIYPDEKVSEEELKDLLTMLESFGTAEVLNGALMDIVPSIASSAPAYALMLISAMADGGCLNGFPRDQAIRLSAQAVLGAAKMVLETGEHPDALKDKICTPGGTTIEAVVSLEEDGFRGSVIKAVNKCAEKSKKLMKK